MTAADHANTIREALNSGPLPDSQPARDKLDAGHDALDALQAQAEDIQREWILESTHHAITGQLAKELEAAEAERDRWKASCARYLAARQTAEAELKEAYAKLERTNESFLAAEAERDRLADALRIIADRTYPATYLGEAKDGTKMYGGSDDASRLARAALTHTEQP